MQTLKLHYERLENIIQLKFITLDDKLVSLSELEESKSIPSIYELKKKYNLEYEIK